MLEPIDAVRPCPRGGWPRASVRIELGPGVRQLPEAVYELACYARRQWIGCVALFSGSDLYAYPHQTTSEITRSWQRMRAMERAGLAGALTPQFERWTERRKAGLVIAVHEGFVTRLDALSRYEISAEEFAGWERRFGATAPDEPKPPRLQALASPEGLESAA